MHRASTQSLLSVSEAISDFQPQNQMNLCFPCRKPKLRRRGPPALPVCLIPEGLRSTEQSFPPAWTCQSNLTPQDSVSLHCSPGYLPKESLPSLSLVQGRKWLAGGGK